MKKLQQPNLQRRAALRQLGYASAGVGLISLFPSQGVSLMQDAMASAAHTFEITKSPAAWQKTLTPEQYRVLRGHGTERAGSSPLNKEHRTGLFVCAGCQLPLFESTAKYESGTGWPSFFAPLPNAVGTKPDNTWFSTRTEVHCRRCGGHLGHMFEDGPAPTGLRYCMNGAAMLFEPATKIK